MEVTRETLKKARTYRRLYKRILSELSEVERLGGPRLDEEIMRLNTDADKVRLRLCAVDDFISSIEDVYARLIIKNKYIDGLTWRAIAMNVGGGNTADSVRMYVSRYLSHLKIK